MSLIRSLLSDDLPKSRVLGILVLLVVLGLAFAPFLFPGSRPVNVAAKICVFIVLVASYDLLLGYTGIVSFAHTMFFGIGGYGVAIAMANLGNSFGALAVGIGAALAVSLVLALAIGMLSLRVQAIFFAMMTLAVASVFVILASQLSWLTGGEDGLTYRLPEVLTPGYRLFEERLFGVAINGRLLSYYLVFIAMIVLFLVMLRVVNSPFGRVLQAIRENPFRAEAIGYRVTLYRTVASCLSALMATMAGVLLAIWLRYNGPDTTLSFDIMIDILLMVVIGGMGTLYGSILGAAIFIMAQNYLQELMGGAADVLSGIPVLPNFFDPDRWLLWLGLLFILSVYFFPSGIAGRLQGKKA